MKNFKIETDSVGKRLDVFLTEHLQSSYSRSFIQKAVKDSYVLLNDKKTKSGYKLRLNDEIEFTPLPEKIIIVEPENIPLNIIYEDDDIVVVNKPAGMVVHPAAGNLSHTLVNALLFHAKGALSNTGAPLRPGVVHRLDKDVSGIMVLAKTDTAYEELIKQFKERSIIKRYIAFVKGKVALSQGKIELPIGRSSRNRKKMAVSQINKKAKPALTYYKVLKRTKDFTQLEIKIETGRTHQIRVHASYIGHPILGDAQYGGPASPKGGPKAKRLMLHALSLKLKHPVNGKELYFEAPLPEEFKN